MEHLNGTQFQPCPTCGSTGHEYGGQSARGCYGCGNTISPTVGVKKVEPRNWGHGSNKDLVGHITHNGRPYDPWGTGRPEQSSAVLRTENGYEAVMESRGPQSPLVRGAGKTAQAAVEAVTHAHAAMEGRKFVKRTAAQRKPINVLGRENEGSSYKPI